MALDKIALGWEDIFLKELSEGIKTGCVRIKYVQEKDAGIPGCECSTLDRLWEKRNHIFGLLKQLERSRNGEYEQLSAECRKEFQNYAYLFGELQRKNHIVNPDKDYTCAKCGTKVPFELFRGELEL